MSNTTNNPIQFRIIVGSYEHNVLCLSLTLPPTQPQTQSTKSTKLSQPFFQPIFHFQAHSLSIRAMDIAKRYLVTGSNDEHIKIYDLQKRKELGTLLQHQGSITKLVFSNEIQQPEDNNDDATTPDDGNDNDNIAHNNKKKRKHHQTKTHKNDNQTPESKHHQQQLQQQYPTHKNGRWLLSAGEDGKIVIWRTKDWEQFGILKGHTGAINDIAIHPSGRVAISVSSDKTIKLWNLMTAKKASTLKLKGFNTLGQDAFVVRFSPSAAGEWFVVGLLNRLLVYKTRDAKVEMVLKNKVTLMCMEFLTLDGVCYLVCGFGDGVIGLWDFEKLIGSTTTTAKTTKSKKGDDANSKGKKPDSTEVKEMDLPQPDIKLQGHASRIKGISIYQEKLPSPTSTTITTTPTGTTLLTYLVSISSDGKIVVWDLHQKDQVAVYDTGERLNVITTVNESIEKANSMKPRYDPMKEEKEEK
ncbi:unnamed protein product [Ambrosiozyma monospora]|uniref:Unnamed protein product n=1 Tax=Ambrosiozyma monospora TaxID=43982 RepID=A0ACB5T4R5_AMBMO|nr:unnamed protein product [Ambrosiozyma monospora]